MINEQIPFLTYWPTKKFWQKAYLNTIILCYTCNKFNYLHSLRIYNNIYFVKPLLNVFLIAPRYSLYGFINSSVYELCGIKREWIHYDSYCSTVSFLKY